MRLNNTFRKKLLNAILFFTKKVKNPTKVKIFKLLYFLDFEHFKETGRSVTNLDYYALDYGPVPQDFYQEVKENLLPKDFARSLALVPFQSETSDKQGAIFKAKANPDMSVFSPREQQIMGKMAEIFKNVNAKEISDISHFKNHPWDKTMQEKGMRGKIDYLLAIDDDAGISREDAENLLKEREEMLKTFPPLPSV